ncbi:MAG: hypothetical protein ACLQBD_17255 [Syntrophobacteraceae bacterium]
MKTIVLVIASIVLLMAGTANANYTADVNLGGDYPTGILITENGVPVTTSGGPIGPSTLNGAPLEYVYCIDLYKNVPVPADYPHTLVTADGYIYGNLTPGSGTLANNAAQIAWLLGTYGTAPTTDVVALQAAIWHEEYLGTSDPVNLVSNAPQVTDYNNYLSALGSNTGNVANFLWMTPTDGSGNQYQAEVGALPSAGGSETPIPGAAWLFGSGLFWLAAFRKRFIG